ncbi:MAG TPA: Ig-like domain-containing protein [Polyangiaceae bacterium]|nr:Ig-like domain-containing protein [Polyangiaceae bacterium]
MPVFRFRIHAPAVVALVTAVACGGDDATPPYSPPPDAAPSDVAPPDASSPDASSPDAVPPPPPDTTAPTLKQRIPETGDDNVWAGAPIRLLFSEPLAPGSVDEAAVLLQSEAGAVAKRTTLSDDGREIRVVIESPHLGPAKLTVTVANTVTDVAGNAFAGASWSFNVPLWQRPGAMAAASGTGPLRPALALDPGQNPVIAWQDAAAIRVSRLIDGRWQRLAAVPSVRSNAVASGPRIAVTSEDEPIVAWQESAEEQHIYVKRYRGGSWELMGAEPVDAGSGKEAGEPVLVIDEDDRPVLAWIEDKSRVEIRRWEGNAWQPAVAAWVPGFSITDLALALEGTFPVVAVTATGARSSDVRVVRWRTGGTGGKWELIGAPLDRAIEHAATRPSLAISRDGVIGVAWQENDGLSDNVYAAGYDEVEGAWRFWGKALDVDFDASAVTPSLGFMREGTPTVAWSEAHVAGARTYVGRFNGTVWDVPGAGLDPVGSRSSMSAALVLDNASNPVLVWEARGEAEGGAIAEVQARRYNGGPELPFGLVERRPPPCAFPEVTADFPRTLSETKCFTDVPRRVPAPGLIPYDVNSPLWSDGAIKRRFIILPEGRTIVVSDKLGWQFPVGAILVKEFLFEREPGNPATIFPMETRFLIKRCESGACRAAWEGYSYQWNDDATEATLLDNTNQTIFKDWPSGGSVHRHSYPSRGECTQCHVNVAGGVLGLQTVQMNRNFDYGGAVDNQLRALARAGVFGSGPPMDGGVAPDGGASIDGDVPPDGGVSPDAGFSFGPLDALPRLPTPGDVAYSVNERVRSYFHSNCSHCHRPDGRWPVINLLYDAPLIGAKEPNHNICDELVPGDAEASRLFIKDSARLGSLPPDFFGLPMPPLATLLPDQRQLPTLKAWINQMETCP